MSESKSSLAQFESSMFERNIAIKAAKEEEVQVNTFVTSITGFLCGLDEDWVQVCGGESSKLKNNWDLVLINRSNISFITSTGRTISDIDPKVREYVQRKIGTFVSVSKTFQDKKRSPWKESN